MGVTLCKCPVNSTGESDFTLLNFIQFQEGKRCNQVVCVFFVCMVANLRGLYNTYAVNQAT